MDKYAIYSAGGFGREVKTAFASYHGMVAQSEFEIVFIDDGIEAGSVVNGVKVISYDEAKESSDLKVCVAFADPELRKRKFEQCEADGLSSFSIIAPSVIRYDGVVIGKGSILADNTMITCNATIGKAFHLNIYSYVAHDCIVGDFVTLAPRVSLNGRIKVEDNVYIGSDATFLPGNPDKFITIGEGAVIGAGALVTKDVEPNTTVIGNPAKILRR